jgi:hypothetical protein
MPVPSAITDLSTTAASNFPAGSDAPSTIDDTLRAHGAFIAQLRDGPHVPALASAGAPAYAFVGDTNTGVFSPGANIWGVATDGTERLRITAAGLIQDGASLELGYKVKPVGALEGVDITRNQRGKCIPVTGNSVFASGYSYVAGEYYAVYNNSASAVTVTGDGVTLRLGGTTSNGVITIAPRGMAEFWFVSSTEAVAWGAGLSI